MIAADSDGPGQPQGCRGDYRPQVRDHRSLALSLAAEHAEALTEVLVHDLELSELEIDEFWSFVQRRIAISPQRTHPGAGR